MIKNKKSKITIIFIIGILALILIPNILSYSTQSIASTQPGMSSIKYMMSQGIELSPMLNKDKCGAGQDLLIQINPLGCQPAVVRSDLLEEQDVPVFCPLVVTKINPLIDIQYINKMSLSKISGSDEFKTVGFHPATAAISGPKTFLDSSVLENVGYAVIVLKKQKNESGMPNYATGTVKAKVTYNIENVFGTGKSSYYLPILTNDEWDQNYKQYSFWKGKGYLRLESLNDNSAYVSVYRDKENKYSTVSLQEGKLSNEIFIPGYYCLARMQLKLEKAEITDTFAEVNVNDDVYQLKEGEQFLDNKCKLTRIDNVGLIEKTTIYCQEDEKSNTFELINSPKIKLNIDGKEGNYEIGQKLFVSKSNPDKNVYLAGAYTKSNSGKTQDLEVFLLQAPIHDDKITYDKIKDMKSTFDNYKEAKNKVTGVVPIDVIIGIVKIGVDTTKEVYKWLADGKSLEYLEYGKEIEYENKKIKVVGFGDAENKELNNDFKKAFDKSIQEYKKLGEQYPNERITETSGSGLDGFKTYSEKGLWEAQELAKDTGQFRTRIELLQEFAGKYPDSKFIEEVKSILENYENSNSEINTREVIIDSQTKKISFQRIYEPSADDYGAVIKIEGAENNGIYTLRKNERLYLNGKEYVDLLEVKEGSVKISLVGIEHNSIKETFIYDASGAEIKLNDYQYIGNKRYKLTVAKINLRKIAKVSLNPRFVYEGTETNFTFKIGIEKRAIQLSPEKIKSKIDNLDSQLKKWTSISNNLNKLTENWKKVCLLTGAYFTINDFFYNTGGKAIARQKVMRNSGGWTDICSSKVSKGEYYNMDSCFINNSDAIDRDVDRLTNIIESQNTEIQKIQDKYKTTSFTESAVDENKLIDSYIPNVKSSLSKVPGGSVTDGKNTIKISEVLNLITNESWKNGNFDIEELRDAELNSQILNSDASSEMKAMAQKQLYSNLNNIQISSDNFVERTSWAKEIGINAEQIPFIRNEKSKAYSYEDKTLKDFSKIFGDEKVKLYGENTPVAPVQTSNGNYIIVLDDSAGKDTYPIAKQGEELMIYDSRGNQISKDKIPDELRNIYFEKVDPSSYKNPYQNAEIKYFETGIYKGFPAIVPFDLKNGWYAATRQTLPIFGNVKAYDESARVTNFYLCNVGEGGKEEYIGGNDKCEMINLNSMQLYTPFSRLDASETNLLVKKAVHAIEEAQRAYKNGVDEVSVTGAGKIKVGEPATSSPDVQCQDFMSPKDCYTLFNVCDPVICPTSRCNLGGTYNVPDVIQSGIFGSIALCLPNYKEGIIAPVCLSGINAGVENLLTMATSYRDCLQESLNSGQQIGVCDQIHSIYMCEFLWRQAAPLANIGIPKLFSALAGQGARGGGEYLSVNAAWENAQNSVSYLKDYYGANAYKSFKVRSTDNVGSVACKSFVSIVYPNNGNLIDNLLEADSPVQYSAWYSEIPFTTSTNPPISQYKIYYHIFAGKDQGASYRVYLKTPVGSSFYQEAPTILIGSGYLAQGGVVDKTRDLTGAAGYKELCISINSQEQCGFKQVSTSFLSTYVTDQFKQEQASQKNIKTEAGCISGSASFYSLFNSGANLQEATNEAINPQLNNYGITRICATESPGKGTDVYDATEKSRWVEVGYCTNQNIKCWLDTESVKNSISITSIENQTLDQVTANYMEALKKEGGYLTESEYNDIIKSLKEVVGNNVNEGKNDNAILNKAISEITTAIEKVLFSNEKAELFSFETRAYNKLARNIFNAIPKVAPPAETPKQAGQTDVKNLGQDFLDRVKEYDSIISDASTKYGVDKCLITAIIRQESNGVSTAINKDKTAFGLMQVKEVAARDVKDTYNNAEHNKLYSAYIKDPYNIEANIKLGTAYYKITKDRCNKLTSDKTELKKLSLAAYNWGIGNVQNNCKSGKFATCTNVKQETLDYVPSILDYESSCTRISIFGENTEVTISEQQLRDKIISTAKGYVKTFSPPIFSDKFKYVDEVYNKINLEKSCVYSEENKIHKKLSQDQLYKSTGITQAGTPYDHLSCDKCNSCTVDSSNLEQGDIVQFYVGSLEEDTAIFEKWNNQQNKDAQVYGVKDPNSKIVEYYKINFNQKPITMIWKPDFENYKEVSNPGEMTTGTGTTESKNIASSTKCEDCGGGIFDNNICDEQECYSIGRVLGINCVFSNKFPLFGGSCEGGSLINLDSAISQLNQIKTNDLSFYSTTNGKLLINSIYSSGIITENEYNDLQGKIVNNINPFGKPRNANYLRDLLIDQKVSSWTLQTAIDEIKNRNKSGTYADNPKFIEKLLKNNVILQDEYNTVLSQDKTMNYLQNLLKSRTNAEISAG